MQGTKTYSSARQTLNECGNHFQLIYPEKSAVKFAFVGVCRRVQSLANESDTSIDNNDI